MLLIGSDRVYALDPEGGQLLGTWELGAPVAGDLVVAEGVAYVQAKNQTLFALGSKWGEVLWKFSLEERVPPSGPSSNSSNWPLYLVLGAGLLVVFYLALRRGSRGAGK